jgi:hypothetical protein
VEINIYEAKTRLSQLIERALAGEEVIIAKAGKPMVTTGKAIYAFSAYPATSKFPSFMCIKLLACHPSIVTRLIEC